MDATYLDIQSVHGRVWPVEWKQETGMAASSTICYVGRSWTGKSQFVCIQVLSRSGEHKNAWWQLECMILSEWINWRACLKILLQLEGEKEGRKEKDRKWGIRSARVNIYKPWETDLRNQLQHSDTKSNQKLMTLWDSIIHNRKNILLWTSYYACKQ